MLQEEYIKMLDGSITLMNQLQKMWKNEIKGCFVQSMIFTVVLILTENKLQYITLKKIHRLYLCILHKKQYVTFRMKNLEKSEKFGRT